MFKYKKDYKTSTQKVNLYSKVALKMIFFKMRLRFFSHYSTMFMILHSHVCEHKSSYETS